MSIVGVVLEKQASFYHLNMVLLTGRNAERKYENVSTKSNTHAAFRFHKHKMSAEQHALVFFFQYAEWSSVKVFFCISMLQFISTKAARVKLRLVHQSCRPVLACDVGRHCCRVYYLWSIRWKRYRDPFRLDEIWAVSLDGPAGLYDLTLPPCLYEVMKMMKRICCTCTVMISNVILIIMEVRDNHTISL